MKILDRYVLKSFLTPFFAAFFVVLLVFVLQVLWLYADDIIGKGIGFLPIAEMMMYLSAVMVPMSLPVSILLASIMTFGNLSENSELTAFKASGIPLSRIMRSLIILMIFVAIGAFVFSNKVIPYANFKYENMMLNIINKKPALSIEPGVFVTLSDFSIRVMEKMPTEDPQRDSIRDVLIHDLRNRVGATTIIRAESGSITTTPDKRYMLLTLYNGQMYDDDVEARFVRRARQAGNKSTFVKQVFPIDISSFTMGDIRQGKDEKDRYTMLDIDQLSVALDSLKGSYTEFIRNSARDFELRNFFMSLPSDSIMTAYAETAPVKTDTLRDVLSYMRGNPRYKMVEIYRSAVDKVRQANESLTETKVRALRHQSEEVNNYGLEIQRKYALAFLVIVLFFVGAPLGALIRKGGIGLPVVVAISIFVLYNIIFMSAERMGKEGSLDVVSARWLPTWILLPFGIWLTYRATKDKVIVNLDPLLNLFDRLWAKVPQKYKQKIRLNKRKEKNGGNQTDLQ